MALLIANLGGVANDRARARTAADAAALAGVLGGRDAAVDIARRNGGDVEQYDSDGNHTTVRVRVGRARATASAARSGVGTTAASPTSGSAPAAWPP